MSTLSEHTGNGNSTETSLQLEDTKEQIYGVLQHFDVLPSSFDRFMFRSISVYLIGLLFGELLTISPIISQLHGFSMSGDCVLLKCYAISLKRSAFISPMVMPTNSISAFLRTIVMPSQARKDTSSAVFR